MQCTICIKLCHVCGDEPDSLLVVVKEEVTWSQINCQAKQIEATYSALHTYQCPIDWNEVRGTGHNDSEKHDGWALQWHLSWKKHVHRSQSLQDLSQEDKGGDTGVGTYGCVHGHEMCSQQVAHSQPSPSVQSSMQLRWQKDCTWCHFQLPDHYHAR